MWIFKHSYFYKNEHRLFYYYYLIKLKDIIKD